MSAPVSGTASAAADSSSKVLPYKLPADFDVAAACKADSDCDACAFYCASPCARAYYRSVRCFDQYKPKVGVAVAGEQCRWYALACHTAHAEEMDRLDREWEATEAASKKGGGREKR